MYDVWHMTYDTYDILFLHNRHPRPASRVLLTRFLWNRFGSYSTSIQVLLWFITLSLNHCRARTWSCQLSPETAAALRVWLCEHPHAGMQYVHMGMNESSSMRICKMQVLNTSRNMSYMHTSTIDSRHSDSDITRHRTQHYTLIVAWAITAYARQPILTWRWPLLFLSCWLRDPHLAPSNRDLALQPTWKHRRVEKWCKLCWSEASPSLLHNRHLLNNVNCGWQNPRRNSRPMKPRPWISSGRNSLLRLTSTRCLNDSQLTARQKINLLLIWPICVCLSRRPEDCRLVLRRKNSWKLSVARKLVASGQPRWSMRECSLVHTISAVGVDLLLILTTLLCV